LKFIGWIFSKYFLIVSKMSYPGLLYPQDIDYVTNVKNRGYFILVNRESNNIALVPGGEINTYLNTYRDWIFVFGMNIVGTRQDIIDALYLLGYGIPHIEQIISSGISIENVQSEEAQKWINIFKQQNVDTLPTQVTQVTQIPAPRGYAVGRRNDIMIDKFIPGDIVSYVRGGKTITGVIDKTTPKTYQIGMARVPHQNVRQATEEEAEVFLREYEPPININDFMVGMKVGFPIGKKKGVVGIIEKLNPNTAVIRGRLVPYALLRRTYLEPGEYTNFNVEDL
jgi:hypothetical protein